MSSTLTPENQRRFREVFQGLPDEERAALIAALNNLQREGDAAAYSLYRQIKVKLTIILQHHGWRETLGALVPEFSYFVGDAIDMQEMAEEIAAGFDGYREATAGTAHGPRNQIWQIYGEIISVPDLQSILAEDRRLPLLRPRVRSLLEHLVQHPESSWAQAAAAAAPPYPRASVREAFEDALRHGQRRKHNPTYQPKSAQAALASRRPGPRLVERQDHPDHPPTAA